MQKTRNHNNAPTSELTGNSYRRSDFSEQCWIILHRMLNGEKLTMRSAIDTGIGDIRRRATDLIQFHRIPVKRQWAVHNNIRQNYKWYFLEEEDIEWIRRKLTIGS